MRYGKFAKYKIYFAILASILLIPTIFLLNKNSQEIEPSQPIPLEQAKQEEVKSVFNVNIQSLIESESQNLPGTYAIYIKDLKSGATYQNKSDLTLTSASIYKLAVMYKTYDEIEKGNLNKNSNLVGNKQILDKRILGQNQSTPAPDDKNSQNISFTVEKALNNMITFSDNYSALLLAEKLGWKNIDSFLKQNGVTNFNLYGPNTPNVTAQAAANLLEKIYKKEAISQMASEEMINLLLSQQINDRIPKYLPTEIRVAHKTGELDTVRHDAGIVFGDKSNYIFVFLTETKNQKIAAENIAIISKKIFEALENP